MESRRWNQRLGHACDLGIRPECAGVLVPHAEGEIGKSGVHIEGIWNVEVSKAGGHVVGSAVLSRTRVATRVARI